MSNDKLLRDHLMKLLDGRQAHVDFDAAVSELAFELQGRRPEGSPYSPWQVMEHLRISQWDILEFSRKPDHVSPKWPEGYWPKEQAPPSPESWERSAERFRSDLQAMKDLVADPENDLFSPIPQGQGQTLLREALLLADHNSYHLGQLVLLRRLLSSWTG